MDLRELQKSYLDNLRKVTEEKLEIGSLIRTVISIDEGLVFKDGRKQKPKKLLEGEYFGCLSTEDLSGIFEVLRSTETLTNKEKKRFGIL